MLRSYSRLGIFWKVTLPITLLLPIGTFVQLYLLGKETEDSAVEMSTRFAQTNIEQFKILRAYYTDQVIRKVKEKKSMEISFDHNGKVDTLPLPATMIHDLSQKISESQSGAKLKLYSDFPFPNRKDRVLNPDQLEAIAHLKSNPSGVFRKIDRTSGKEIVRVAVADKMVNQTCVDCHNSHPLSPFKEWKLGDVRGVLEVEIPIHEQLEVNQAMVTHLGLLNFGVAGTLLGIIVLTLLYQVKKPIQEIIGRFKDSVKNEIQTSSLLSKASAEVSEVSTQQAAAVQETVSSLHEITSMTDRSADRAKASIEVSRNSHQVANDGKASVEQMIQAIGDIDTNNQAIMAQVQDSNKQISEIIQLIREIEAKTMVINDIVFQTKLLSFNASVEAARAGEQGKGFAVVAEEVGNLAQMSGRASKEISDMLSSSIQKVQAIITDTQTNVQNIVQSGKSKVQAGNLIAQQCGKILEEVVRNVEQMDSMMLEVCRASEEQAKGVNGITQAMAELDVTASRNSASAENTAKISDTLLDHAETLSDLVKKFELEALGRCEESEGQASYPKHNVHSLNPREPRKSDQKKRAA